MRVGSERLGRSSDSGPAIGEKLAGTRLVALGGAAAYRERNTLRWGGRGPLYRAKLVL